MGKQLKFSSTIDVLNRYYFSFTLVPLDKQSDSIEISASNSPSVEQPDLIFADVWAGIADGDTKRFLYTEVIPKSEIDIVDYAKIAARVHNSPQFLRSLNKIYNEL